MANRIRFVIGIDGGSSGVPYLHHDCITQISSQLNILDNNIGQSSSHLNQLCEM